MNHDVHEGERFVFRWVYGVAFVGTLGLIVGTHQTGSGYTLHRQTSERRTPVRHKKAAQECGAPWKTKGSGFDDRAWPLFF